MISIFQFYSYIVNPAKRQLAIFTRYLMAILSVQDYLTRHLKKSLNLKSVQLKLCMTKKIRNKKLCARNSLEDNHKCLDQNMLTFITLGFRNLLATRIPRLIITYKFSIRYLLNLSLVIKSIVHENKLLIDIFYKKIFFKSFQR